LALCDGGPLSKKGESHDERSLVYADARLRFTIPCGSLSGTGSISVAFQDARCRIILLGGQHTSVLEELKKGENMLLLIIILLLLFGGGGGYYGYSHYGPAGGGGIFFTVLVICLIVYLLRGRSLD
jgi:hypothetical protein